MPQWLWKDAPLPYQSNRFKNYKMVYNSLAILSEMQIDVT